MVSGVDAPKKPRNKTTRTTSKKNDTEVTAAMVAQVIQTTSNLCALRAGQHWCFSPEECQKIAEPATAIMERFDLVEKFGKFGDFIALGAALFAAAAPRVMYGMMTKKEETKNAVRNEDTNQPTEPAKPQAATGGSSDTGVHSSTTTNGLSPTKQLVAAVVGESY